VEESEVEALLKQVYRVARLPPPERIHWVDGPLHLVEAVTPQQMRESLEDSVEDRLKWSGLEELIETRVYDSVWSCVWPSVEARVGGRVWWSVKEGVLESVASQVGDMEEEIVWASVTAYREAVRLAFARFFAEYWAPNDLAYLAHFNERVSGYWLGREEALLVRRPRLLAQDTEGYLHSEQGKCLEYRDGWGIHAWHGVRVPERVILAPERLTREDFLGERDVEVRRVMQERMGGCFVSELGGQTIDTSPCGTLYEVRLPEDDPERVARYVQVQDASTERRYFLRVPPTMQTAAEAVAWTFQVAPADYRPAQET
jgi:hypothetical protein